jgi:hypothetical protein
LNFVKDNSEKRYRSFHPGHIITEIISSEQFNDPKFMPRTWVNREDVGLSWAAAVSKIKEAEKNATLNTNGHYIEQ